MHFDKVGINNERSRHCQHSSDIGYLFSKVHFGTYFSVGYVAEFRHSSYIFLYLKFIMTLRRLLSYLQGKRARIDVTHIAL